MTDTFWLPGVAATGALVSAGTLWGLRRTRVAALVADVPNERSLHARVVPRIGGLGIAAGLLAAAAVATSVVAAGAAGTPALLGMLAGYLALVAVSLVDDLRGLGARLRLAIHLGVTVGWLALVPPTPSWWWPVVALAIAWGANLYNFMDGADGLAGSMALIGFGAYALGADAAGQSSLALLAGGLAGAAAGFLLFNAPPASLFMGDCGSIPLGFAAGALGWYGVSTEAWSPIFPILAFFPFVFDASLTLLRRIIAGEHPARPHREHLYQRLIRSGYSHRVVASGALLLMTLCAAVALLSRAGGFDAQSYVLAACCVIGFTAARWVDRVFAQR